jgi:hypothetical protein
MRITNLVRRKATRTETGWTRHETCQVRAADHTHSQHGRNMRLLQYVAICLRLSIRQYQAVSD